MEAKEEELFQKMIESIAHDDSIDETPPPNFQDAMIYDNKNENGENHQESAPGYFDIFHEYSSTSDILFIMDDLLSSITEENMDELAELVADWVIGV